MNKPTSKKTSILLMLVLFLPVAWIAIKLAMIYRPNTVIWEWLPNLTETLKKPFEIIWTDKTWTWLGVSALLYLFTIAYYKVSMGKRRIGKEHGSAAWTTASEVNRKYSQSKATNKIITQNIQFGIDDRVHRRNMNTMIIGSPGTGKSRFYVKPNLMQCNTSYVITDPKGELLASTGDMLLRNGYDIKVINLIELTKSQGYNCFSYIRKEEDVLRLITNLIRNTTPRESKSNDPFWEKAETALLQALMYYLIEDGLKEDQHFGSVLELLECADIDEERETVSALDMMMDSLELKNPNSLAVAQYKIFKQAAGKTAKTILVSTAVRLSSFNIPAIRKLISHDELDISSIGEKKTALFAIIPDMDQTFNHIIGMLYTQVISELYYQADHVHKGRLPLHVQFVMDEFANVAVPESFDVVLGTMRSRNMSANIILQSLSQLKAMFKGEQHTWEKIIGHCDTILYLGSNDMSTCEYITKLLGKETIDTRTYGLTRGRNGSYSTNKQIAGRELLSPDEVSQLDNRYCIVRIRGEKPVIDDKYNILKHPKINQTTDGKDETVMPYEKSQTTSTQFLDEHTTHLADYIDLDRVDDFEIINF